MISGCNYLFKDLNLDCNYLFKFQVVIIFKKKMSPLFFGFTVFVLVFVGVFSVFLNAIFI